MHVAGRGPKVDREGNPLLYLFRKTWHYSAGNRQKAVWPQIQVSSASDDVASRVPKDSSSERMLSRMHR